MKPHLSLLAAPACRGGSLFPATAALLSLGFAWQAHAANLCINPGFETAEATSIFGYPGVPSVFGDLSQIVLAERDVLPFDGSRMLRFDATGNAADPALNSGQIYQLVNVSAFGSLIDAGAATATLAAWFNRVAGDSQTDSSFAAGIYALSGSPAGFQSHLINNTYLAVQGTGLLSDGDTGTWEQVSVNMALPVGTD